MKTQNFPSLSLLGAAILLSSCATANIPKTLRAQVDPSLTFEQMRKNPEAHKGKTMVIGGEVLRVNNQADGSYLEILQAPLDGSDRPRETELSQGRFIAYSKEYIDPEVYALKRQITIAGEVEGKKVQPLEEGQADYAYPLLKIAHIHLWPPPAKNPANSPVHFGVGLGFGTFLR